MSARALGIKGKPKGQFWDCKETNILICMIWHGHGRWEPSRRTGGCHRRGREKVHSTNKWAGESYRRLLVDTAAFEGHQDWNQKPQATSWGWTSQGSGKSSRWGAREVNVVGWCNGSIWRSKSWKTRLLLGLASATPGTGSSATARYSSSSVLTLLQRLRLLLPAQVAPLQLPPLPLW